jgi:hypothetical protein
LGGVPEHVAAPANLLFIALLLVFIAVVCKRFARD